MEGRLPSLTFSISLNPEFADKINNRIISTDSADLIEFWNIYLLIKFKVIITRS